MSRFLPIHLHGGEVKIRKHGPIFVNPIEAQIIYTKEQNKTYEQLDFLLPCHSFLSRLDALKIRISCFPINFRTQT